MDHQTAWGLVFFCVSLPPPPPLPAPLLCPHSRRRPFGPPSSLWVNPLLLGLHRSSFHIGGAQTFKLHSDFSPRVIISRKQLIIPFTRLLTPERYFTIYDLPSLHCLGRGEQGHIGGEKEKRMAARPSLSRIHAKKVGLAGIPHDFPNLDSDL